MVAPAPITPQPVPPQPITPTPTMDMPTPTMDMPTPTMDMPAPAMDMTVDPNDPFVLMMDWPREPLPLDDAEVVACIARGMAEGTPEACAQCTCQRCMPEADAVYLNADADLKARATGLVNCGLATCCAGASCFCQTLGDGSAIDLNGCATESLGPCKTEVETAAGMEGLVLIQTPCEQDPTNPCFQARQLGLCTTGDPIPLNGQPIEGACTAECQMCM